MKRILFYILASAFACTVIGDASGRGWGGGGGRGFGGGGGWGGGGGFDRGGFSGGGSYGHSESGGFGNGFSSFSGSDRAGGSYSGSRSTSSYSGFDSRGASGSYDHTWSDAAGGSISTSGSRSVEQGRYGGVAASGSRDTTVTTASGKTYSADRSGAVASGPGGRTVGGASGSVDGARGNSASWNTAFAGNRYGDMSHYSSMGATTGHGTAYWSNSYTTSHAYGVRTGFGYYNCFHPAWYTAHPGAWAAAGWAAGSAWTAASYATVSDYCGLAASAAPDYDYGSTVVINNDNIYMNGSDTGVTAAQYADQATTIADAGQTAMAPPTDEWKPLGVYALAAAGETTSNNIFQLAVNKAGVIRGNYYDGLMDTTTEVYGSIDKTTQRAAWTIGKKKDRVFDAGVYNLTQPQCPVLLHLGSQKTEQMMLVRIEDKKTK